jgi:DNA-binding transcriptional LysR family regulator
MSRLRPADLALVLAISRHRSFRRAAIELAVTPSALSHALRALEERIDVRLFNRTTRSVAPTEAGQRLIDRIEPVFRDIDDALDDLDRFRGAPMGTLRLNVPPSSGQLVLMPFVSRFLALYPAVSVELVAQNALVDVVSQGFDAGVRFGETIAADMIAVPIGPRVRFAAVASPAYFDRWPRPSHPRDLASLPCVRYRFDSGADYHWEFECGGIELTTAVEGRFATNAQDLMLQAALDGLGIAYVFEGLADEAIRAGHLERVLEDWCPYWPGLYLYYPSRRQLPGALRAFVDFVKSGR